MSLGVAFQDFRDVTGPGNISHHDDQIEIQLSYGEWIEQKLTRSYRVRMGWKDWSAATRNYVSREIETARLEYMAAKKRG